MSALLPGAAAIFLATVLAGVSGFGYGLIAVPLLLLIGLPLTEIVVVNLALALTIRLIILWRFRSHVHPGRAARLVLGSLPGIGLGLVVRDAVDTDVLEATVGVVALAAAGYLALRPERAAPRRLPGDMVLAGATGGFLGTTTSLNGVVPALLLTHVAARPLSFLADLAVFFVGSNAVMLAVLVARDGSVLGSLAHYLPYWLPVAVAGSLVGAVLAPRLPREAFRRLTLALIAAAGCATLATVL